MANASDFNTGIIDEFRKNRGIVGGPFQGMPLLLLHTTGARSGAMRVNPVAYRRVGDGAFAVFAAKAGAPTNPDWFHNLVAHPDVTVEVGAETIAATARVAKGDERARIWAEQKQAAPTFADYEQRTAREIPVVIIEPRDRAPAGRS